MRARVPWSDRRRTTLIGLGTGTVVLGAGSFLPDEYGVTSLFLAALCAFLFVVAAYPTAGRGARVTVEL